MLSGKNYQQKTNKESTMANCRYCNKEITWLKDGKKFTPVESDGGTHNCENYKNSQKSIKQVDLSTIDPEILKQYQENLNNKRKK
jgi:hypothetical protein